MNKSFKFSNGRFNLVVMARTLKRARQYVKDGSISAIRYRSLKYIGEGHPGGGTWVAAVADKPDVPDWIKAPVSPPPGYRFDEKGYCVLV